MAKTMINYLELPAHNIVATKAFFQTVFGWKFTDFGGSYAAFSHKEAGIDGGFFQSELKATADTGSVLVVFYSQDLTSVQEKITQAGGKITKATFTFPGGKRFHFSDVNGNEFAVWSDK